MLCLGVVVKQVGHGKDQTTDTKDDKPNGDAISRQHEAQNCTHVGDDRRHEFVVHEKQYFSTNSQNHTWHG